MKTLIIDNYDSFTYNLYQIVGEVDEPPIVRRNDAITVNDVERLAPDRIIISPGPGHPADPAYFGICREVLLQVSPRIPTLGVCLGHQGIALAYGARVVRAKQVMHGKTSMIYHDESDLFTGLTNPFEAMRYHSLVVDPDSLPRSLELTARTQDGVIMGLRHVEYAIHGVQFHPESIGTSVGHLLIENFLFLADVKRRPYLPASVPPPPSLIM